jgi:Arc/MetJ-type ribon-helix-helix transcriptional regulator
MTTVKLNPKMQKIVAERMKAGDFATAEEVVLAGLQALEFRRTGDFEPGELDALLAESEKNIKEEGTLDGDEAYVLRRAERAVRRTIGTL